MATNDAVLKRLEQKGAEADQVIEYLKRQVALLKERVILQATLREEKKLGVEDAKLKREIEGLKRELTQAEIHNGIKQVPVPSSSSLETNCAVSKSVIQSASVTTTTSSGTKEEMKGGGGEEKKVKEKTEKKGEKIEKQQQSAAASLSTYHAWAFDLVLSSLPRNTQMQIRCMWGKSMWEKQLHGQSSAGW